MNVTFACPKCHSANRADLNDSDATLRCARCDAAIRTPAGAIVDGQLNRCLVCPSGELFVRKDFPQRLGVALVVVGFLASSVAWYYYRPVWAIGILMATALVDLVLYLLMGEALVCYRCQAHYRRVNNLATHRPFDLATHERYRQEAARLGKKDKVQNTE